MNKIGISPFDKEVKAKGHTAQYRIHKYYARRPYNVFRSLIEHYSKPSDIVLDVFCGGGVTIFESLAVNRKTIGVDLNPLATFITEMQLKKINIEELRSFLYAFLDKMKEKYKFFYEYEISGKNGDIEWVEWAYQVECPNCKSDIILDESSKIRNGVYKCPNVDCLTNNTEKPGVKRTHCKPKSIWPLKIKFRPNDESGVIIHDISSKDEIHNLMNANYSSYLTGEMDKPNAEIPQNWDRANEDKLLSKGVKHFSDFFTNRNYTLNVLIFNEILELKKTVDINLVDSLYFAFSASLRYTNNMTRVTKNWENGNPTSMDKHAYWLPNQFVETNVFDKLENRIKAILKGLLYTDTEINYPIVKANSFEDLKAEADYMMLTQSSSELPIPDQSVDVVITDPPYGSNVQYGELSAFWNVWLKKYKGLDSYIYNDDEAIMNRKKSIEGYKDINHYETVLNDVFNECHRVLKDDGYLVFTFNNKNIKVWFAILHSIARAGFYLPENGVTFQDFISSYKNTSHLRYSGNVHGDFIYSFKKGKPNIILDKTEGNSEDIVKNNIEKTIKEMYIKHNSYSTTQLYQEIFTKLVNVILDLINTNLYSNPDELIELEKYSDEFIDNIIKENLQNEEDKWIMKR